MKRPSTAWMAMVGIGLLACDSVVSQDYTPVDTGQSACYNATAETACPQPGEPFYGQDAQCSGIQSSYQDNGDGTVSRVGSARWAALGRHAEPDGPHSGPYRGCGMVRSVDRCVWNALPL